MTQEKILKEQENDQDILDPSKQKRFGRDGNNVIDLTNMIDCGTKCLAIFPSYFPTKKEQKQMKNNYNNNNINNTNNNNNGFTILSMTGERERIVLYSLKLKHNKIVQKKHKIANININKFFKRKKIERNVNSNGKYDSLMDEKERELEASKKTKPESKLSLDFCKQTIWEYSAGDMSFNNLYSGGSIMFMKPDNIYLSIDCKYVEGDKYGYIATRKSKIENESNIIVIYRLSGVAMFELVYQFDKSECDEIPQIFYFDEKYCRLHLLLSSNEYINNEKEKICNEMIVVVDNVLEKRLDNVKMTMLLNMADIVKNSLVYDDNDISAVNGGDNVNVKSNAIVNCEKKMSDHSFKISCFTFDARHRLYCCIKGIPAVFVVCDETHSFFDNNSNKNNNGLTRQLGLLSDLRDFDVLNIDHIIFISEFSCILCAVTTKHLLKPKKRKYRIRFARNNRHNRNNNNNNNNNNSNNNAVNVDNTGTVTTTGTTAVAPATANGNVNNGNTTLNNNNDTGWTPQQWTQWFNQMGYNNITIHSTVNTAANGNVIGVGNDNGNDNSNGNIGSNDNVNVSLNGSNDDMKDIVQESKNDDNEHEYPRNDKEKEDINDKSNLKDKKQKFSAILGNDVELYNEQYRDQSDDEYLKQHHDKYAFGLIRIQV